MWMLALLVSPEAHAGGYYVSDVGVRSFSRGGAYVAGPDDLLALWYNPAALKRLRDGAVTLNVAGVNQPVVFDREDVPGGGTAGADLVFEPVENEGPAYIIPHLGAAWSFGLPNTTFAFGVYPPYAPDFVYPEDGPQRYTLIDSVVIQASTGVSVAHEIGGWVSLGGGLSWNVLRVGQDLKISILNQLQVDAGVQDPAYDVAFSVLADDWTGVGANAGVLVEPPSKVWAAAVAVTAPTAFSARGSMEVDFRGNEYQELGIIQDETAGDDDVRVDVRMPVILRAGALVRPVENVEIELAGVYEGWSSITEIVLDDVEVPISTTLGDVVIEGPITLPAGYRDTVSARLGGHVDLERVVLRAGGLVETSAIPESRLGVGLVDGNKVGFGLGGTVRVWQLELDGGGFMSFLPTRTITDSELVQIAADPLTGELRDGANVGNGTLSSRIWMLGGGVTWRFGSGPGEAAPQP